MNTTFQQQTPAGHAGGEKGERHKAGALAALERSRAFHILKARRVLLERLLSDGTATIDAVRQVVELPEGIDPKLFGSVPGSLARAKIIERDGSATTNRPKAHARPISIWRLVDRNKAEVWLRDHPVPVIERPVQRELFTGEGQL